VVAGRTGLLEQRDVPGDEGVVDRVRVAELELDAAPGGLVLAEAVAHAGGLTHEGFAVEEGAAVAAGGDALAVGALIAIGPGVGERGAGVRLAWLQDLHQIVVDAVVARDILHGGAGDAQGLVLAPAG